MYVSEEEASGVYLLRVLCCLGVSCHGSYKQHDESFGVIQMCWSKGLVSDAKRVLELSGCI